MITIASPIIESEEIDAVNNVLKSGMLAQGPKVAELEENFAAYCGTKYAVAVNSGTAALHAALYAAGVGPGDEVITVPFSFIATVNPIIMVGATPKFVDIDKVTFNIDTTKLEAAITDKTKAILPVHLYGQPANMDEMKAIAAKYKLIILEDACQAVGAEYKGQKTGALGDMACFSLYATKNIMCGEGGIVTTDNENLATAMKQFRQHGMSGPYQYEALGYNYRMTDLQAAIAVEQLKKTDKFNKKRKDNADFLNTELKGIKGIILPEVAADRTHVYHQYTIRVTGEANITRDTLLEKLKENEIGAGVYYPKTLHTIPHIAKYGFKEGDFPVAEVTVQQVLSLPIHPNVSQDDLKKMVNTLRDLTDVN